MSGLHVYTISKHIPFQARPYKLQKRQLSKADLSASLTQDLHIKIEMNYSYDYANEQYWPYPSVDAAKIVCLLKVFHTQR